MKKKVLILIILVIMSIFALLYYVFINGFNVKFKTLLNLPICNRCNVILISIDTLGSNHLPCYGYQRNTAPNLCKFAKDNIIFTNSYANASWTLPSYFSILTSLYPKHHGMENYNTTVLDKNIPSLPVLLKENGYNTIFIGPTDDPAIPLNRGMERGFDSIIVNKDKQRINGWKEGYQTLLDNSKKGRSTFLFLHTYWAHQPYLFGDLVATGTKRLFTNEYLPQIPLTEEKINEFTPDFYNFLIINGDKKINDVLKPAKDFTQAEKLFKTLSSQDQLAASSRFYMTNLMKNDDTILYARALYDEEIFYLDQKLSELFTLLSEKEIGKNTVVIITSTHGEEFMEHGILGHPSDDLYNNITGIPFIMYIPGLKNRAITDLVQSIDIMPTILNTIGLHKPDSLEGLDLTGLILGQPDDKRNSLLISEGYNIDSIRDSRWKLYVNYTPPNGKSFSLYDLENDPPEQKNVVSQNTNIVDKLANSLETIIYKNTLPSTK